MCRHEKDLERDVDSDSVSATVSSDASVAVKTINTEQNKLIALLGSGDCFGETVLLGEGKRTAAAVVESEVDLWAIEGDFARRELNLEHPMTQYVTLLLLRQVVLLNHLRGFR